MEGLVPATATASTFQLILEHLCAVLLLISEGVRHVSSLSAFLSGVLVGALVMVSLEVKRQYSSRSVKAAGEKCPAHDEGSAGWSEDPGPVTEANDTPKPPVVEASPLRLQTLCLKALNRHLSRMLSLWDQGDAVKAFCMSQPPKRSHVTEEKPASKASGTDGAQLRKTTADGLNKDSRYPESPDRCQGDIMGQQQTLREKGEEKRGLQQSKVPVERVLQGRGSQSESRAGNLVQTSPGPTVLRGHLAYVTMQAGPQREVENGDRFVHGSEDGLKGVPHDADLNVPLPPAVEEGQGRARELWEQKQINEALTGDLANLRTEKASLQRENSNLNAEIEQLKLKLQMVPDVYEDRLTQLQKQLFEAERHCLDLEKKLFNEWRNMDSTNQMLNNYKKMTQDMNQDLQRSTFFYEREIRYHWGRAEAARMATEDMEREIQELQRENDRDRQMLAEAKAAFWPFPGGPVAPAAPPAAHGGPEAPVLPPDHCVPRKDQGRAGKPKKRVTFQI